MSSVCNELRRSGCHEVVLSVADGVEAIVGEGTVLGER